MTPKAPSATMAPPAAAKTPAARGPSPGDAAAQWAEVRLVYPIYAALATQFNFAPLPYPAGELPPTRPTRKVYDRDLAWLRAIDGKVLAYQIRQLPSPILNGSEESLRALVLRHLQAPEKTQADRDKIDFLLVQYFAMCAPEELYHKDIALADVARVLRPVLTGADATPLEWCQPLEEILARVAECQSLRDMMEGGLLEQGRLVKDSAGHMFYDPAALVTFCRFNFLMRRAFVRMPHTDLTAMRKAIHSLEAAGVRTVDCRRAGLSAAEPLANLRRFCESWRLPFHKDYADNSVRRALEQLMALRTDLEEALGGAAPQASTGAFFAPDDDSLASAENPPQAAPSSATRQPAAKTSQSAAGPAGGLKHSQPKPTSPPAPGAQERTSSGSGSAPASRKSSAGAADAHAPRPAAQRPHVPVAPAATAEAEKCLEAIWEQLIAAPPSRGRSMSTVVLQNAKILLSAWEVAAFVSEGGQESEDLRRAVVSRALLAVAIDLRTRSGDTSLLESALSLAHSEVSYFQGRVEQAKRTKNTEAAVNLGISTKRLLSFIEEAEKLLP